MSGLRMAFPCPRPPGGGGVPPAALFDSSCFAGDFVFGAVFSQVDFFTYYLGTRIFLLVGA